MSAHWYTGFPEVTPIGLIVIHHSALGNPPPPAHGAVQLYYIILDYITMAVENGFTNKQRWTAADIRQKR